MAKASPRKVVFATIGTTGDLYPFIAIAGALRLRGFHPVLAVAEDQLDKVRAAGLDAVAVLPPFDAVRRRMGLSEAEAVRQIMQNQRVMLEQVLLPALASSTVALDAICEDAEAIVASIFMFAGAIIAEKRGLPPVSIVLQPMAMLSPYDPPTTPDFKIMRKGGSRAAAVWNNIVFAVIRTVIDRFYHGRLDCVRVAHGLKPQGARFMLDAARSSDLTLGCYSPQFGPLPPDAPAHTLVTGFPLFDGGVAKDGKLEPALAAFLATGPPPIVFTLGTFAVHGSGRFYTEAAEAARLLDRRAVLLTGRTGEVSDGEVHRCAYAPHSLLFPHAAAIVHHGGIGTTGQALRAGKPQLIVPHMGDQYDHAWRIERMGLGHRISAHRFSAQRGARTLAALLSDNEIALKAQRIGDLVVREDGAAAAATAIAALLDGGRARRDLVLAGVGPGRTTRGARVDEQPR